MQTKENKQTYAKRFIVFFLGLCLIQVGVALMLRLNIGSDPFTVFTQGISMKLHITAGAANRIITIVLAVVLLFIDRTYLQVGTILSIVCAGAIMDVMYRMYAAVSWDGIPLLVKCLLFLVALIPIAIGIPMIKLGNLGVAPNDCVYFVLEDRLKQPYSRIRMASDAVYFLFGLLFGGVIGIGTVLCLVCLGPMVGFAFPTVERLVQTFYDEKRATVKA